MHTSNNIFLLKTKVWQAPYPAHRGAPPVVAKVPCGPCQNLEPFVPCTRSSHTHPPARPRYTGWRVSLSLVRPAGRFGGSDHPVWCSPCSWSSDGDAASMDRSKLVEELMKCDLLRWERRWLDEARCTCSPRCSGGELRHIALARKQISAAARRWWVTRSVPCL